MRVNPTLDWEYGHVREFLRGFEIGYCCLSDEGYTSLGNLGNTERNPALFVGEGEVNVEERDGGRYLPAGRLDCAKLERAGRGKQGRGTSGSNALGRARAMGRRTKARLVSRANERVRCAVPDAEAAELREHIQRRVEVLRDDAQAPTTRKKKCMHLETWIK